MDEEFESLVVTNPELVDPSIDISGLRTQTDTSLLGNIPDFPGIQYEAFNPTRLSDLMRLYSTGLPMIDTPPAAVPPATGGGGGGSGDGGQATAPITPITSIEPATGGGITNIDTPLTQMITDPVTGQTQTVRQTMTDNDAYRGTTPSATPVDTSIMVEDFSEPFPDFLGRLGERVSYPGDQSGVIKGAVDPQPVRTILGPDGITYDAVTGQPIYEDLDEQAAATDLALGTQDLVTQQDLEDNTSLLQKLGLPADFNIKQAALEAGINLAVGVPITLLARGLGIGLDALGNIIPSGISNTTNKAREVGLLVGDTTVTKDKYGINTQSQFGDYNQYNVDRVDELEKIVADQTSRGLTNTIQMRELADRKNYLKASGADGDIDERDQMLEDIVLQNKIDAGIQAADDDKGSEMLDTSTGVNPFDTDDFDEGMDFTITPVKDVTQPETVLGKPNIEKFDDAETSIDMFDTTPVDTTPIDTTITGTLGPPSEISGPQVTEEKPVDTELADNRAVKELDSDQVIEYQNLSDQLIGQEIQKTGDSDISMIKQEEIKNKALDQIKEQDLDEFSDEAFMVGDTSTAAPTTGGSGADSFFDAVDTITGGGGGRDRDPDPSPSFDPGQGFVDQGGEGEFGSAPSKPTTGTTKPGTGGGGGGGGGGQDKDGCVIATHAVNSGAFTKDTKREAVRWCVKNLHRTWWGEAIRRGYRYYGQKAIEEGKAKNHYQEFKDYVAFGTGKRRTLKTGWTFVYRSIQFFIRGLING